MSERPLAESAQPSDHPMQDERWYKKPAQHAEYERLANDLEAEAETRLRYGVRSPYNDGVIAGFRSAAKSIRRVLRLIDGPDPISEEGRTDG